MNNPTATIEELKAILDAWIPKYIRQVVELRSGSKLSAERYNELMNLLITQGDDTIELAQVVKQYVELLVDKLSNNFVETTENVTAIAEGAVNTADGAVEDVIAYKESMDARLEEALKEVKDSLTAAEDVIKNAAVIYDKVDEINATTESIITGTQQVGNTKTLDGHGAEYFAPLSDLANYLPLTGGKLTGDLSIAKHNNGSTKFMKNHSASADYGTRIYDISADGKQAGFGWSAGSKTPWFVDNTGKESELLHTGNMASHALPLTGGTVATDGTTPLRLKNNTADVLYLQMMGASGVLGYFAMNGKDKPSFISTTGAVSDILHTGNKPTGTYTGNGSAEQRTIKTGGIGNVCLLSNMDRGMDLCIVSRYGALGKTNKEVYTFNANELNFRDGVLKITTDSVYINGSGSNVQYQVL